MDGVLVIDKPEGWTSHDAVAIVKKALHAKKVGHLGTLDPAATGVLPLVVNGATGFARILEAGDKEYLATLKLGTETDTYDSEGKVVRTIDASGVAVGEIKEAFSRFRGTILQVPPMFSSVKRSGTPLYKLARKGITVERQPKVVEVFTLDVLKVSPPYVEFRAVCSRGTYIRTLSHDIGKALGCGAHLSSLRRTRSGEFTLEGAVGPREPKEVFEKRLIPLDLALQRVAGRFKSISVDEETAARIRLGGRFSPEEWKGFFPFLEDGEMVRFSSCGVLVALAEYVKKGGWQESGVFSIKKVFPAEGAALSV